MELTLYSMSFEKDIYTVGLDHVRILIWCLDENNESVLVRVENYNTFFYYEFQDVEEDEEWSVEDARFINRKLKDMMRDNSSGLCAFEESDFEMKYPLYYHSDRKRPYLKLRFSTFDAMRHASNIIKKQPTIKNIKLSGRILLSNESEIATETKMRVECGVKICSWFKCHATAVTDVDKISTCKQEYEVDYTTLKYIQSDRIPRPLFCSYDAEMYSSNHFAMPNEWGNKDKVYLITMTFFRDGDSEKDWIQYAILCGKCDKSLLSEDINLIEVTSEISGIKTWAKLIREHDPDFLTGYNICSYDNYYFHSRLQLHNKSWPVVGRLRNMSSIPRNITWGSNAQGDKNMWITHAPGRQTVDYMEHIMRSERLSSYSLNNVSKHILNNPDMTKKDLPAITMFKIYDEMKKTIKTGEGNGLQRMSITVDYGMRDSNLVCHMASQTKWWLSLSEMCKIVGNTPQSLLCHGQQARVLSLLYEASVRCSVILDSRDPVLFYYEGGLVQKPVRGVNDSVVTLDFVGLYPSIMDNHNLCYNTLLRDEDVHKYKDEDVTKIEVSISKEEGNKLRKLKPKERKALPYTKVVFSFVKKSVKEGILPKVLNELITQRAYARKCIETSKDQAIKNLMNHRQLALKLVANSVYGFTGVIESPKKQCLEITSSVTCIGRTSITKAINTVIEIYPQAKLIYGDTDSCMISLVDIDKKDIHRTSRELAKRVSSQFVGSMEMSLESVDKIFSSKPKNYAKIAYLDPNCPKTPPGMGGTLKVNGENKFIVSIKGMSPTRRDTSNFCRLSHFKLIYSIIAGEPYSKIISDMIHGAVDLYKGKIDMKELIISKKMGKGYDENAPMKIFGDEMMKLGKIINPGERHDYVVISNGRTKISEKMMLVSIIEDNPDTVYQIDYGYYYGNLLVKKLDTTLQAAFEKYDDILRSVFVEVGGKKYYMNKPASAIFKIMSRRDRIKILIKLKKSCNKKFCDLRL